MSDTKNHKKMFDVLQVAIKDKKLLVAILFQTMRDNPASIGNAYDKVMGVAPPFPEKDVPNLVSRIVTCGGCRFVFRANDRTTECPKCGHKIKQSESP